ncbi:exodeoxyribonuclease VII large subunit [Zwartia sp.]|uniref:exodeoxyribonuclease VII large subunit n=1 Tax=Zwartia sp. TaxID=2978004 RepID=UPI002720EEA6|nr:exodeoxyribonuclease VII large subunit [Zwartia sp.]MDO9023781.1 exodeoxyribonuclease VII large subunit [Zwartia sp.]
MTLSDQPIKPALTRDILTVSELNQAVARLLEDSFDVCWVRGEVSNFTPAASGHWYFTLKDNGASVRAVMFRSRALAVGFIPKSGDSVEIKGRVTLYEARGEYQIQVDQLRRAGLGSLFEAFLALKSKLASEGLFDQENKRDITTHPRAIGVITSLSAAALRDVLTALERRAPHVPVVIYPAMVQGADSALQLRQALAIANERQEVDTLLLVRGGGSIEDLWSFNDEALARDISASVIPVVSGVGHETDFTIADFVADLRAPTPTAAAELVCTARIELLDKTLRATERLVLSMRRKLDQLSQRVDRVSASLVSPTQRLSHQSERLRGLVFRLRAAFQRSDQQRLRRADSALTRLRSQLPEFSHQSMRVQRASQILMSSQRRLLEQRVVRLTGLKAQLRALSPEQTLSRGYAIVRTQDGEIVKSSHVLSVGQPLSLRLASGGAVVKVDQVK